MRQPNRNRYLPSKPKFLNQLRLIGTSADASTQIKPDQPWSTLASFEARVRLVDDVHAPLATNETIITVTSTQRLQRILDFHGANPGLADGTSAGIRLSAWHRSKLGRCTVPIRVGAAQQRVSTPEPITGTYYGQLRLASSLRVHITTNREIERMSRYLRAQGIASALQTIRSPRAFQLQSNVRSPE
jgi:hypothetical protein